ncbi:MAG: DUF342 domain-containing protein [Thermodesulfobacteriota bacterium]
MSYPENEPFTAMQAQNIFQTRVAPASPGGDTLGYELDSLIKSSLQLFANDYPGIPFIPEKGIIRQLTDLLEIEKDVFRHRHIANIINSIRNYFHFADPDQPETNTGQIRISVSRDKLIAFLTLTSPRGEGRIPTVNAVRETLSQAGIVYGINTEVIEKSVDTIRQAKDVVWRAVVAYGEKPTPQLSGKLKYHTNVIDKSLFRRDLQAAESSLGRLWKPIAEEEIIGVITDHNPGVPGKDVFEKDIPPPKAALNLDIGNDIALSPGKILSAQTSGYVIIDENRIDIVPLYVMEHPVPGSVVDFYFPGAVLVLGGLRGPGTIECEDLFILGNCEQMKIVSHHDVFITGGIVGHHQTSIDADGGIYSSFVSEARLSALGEIIVSNAILYSHIISNGITRVTSEKGIIAGGAIYSLKGIVAATIGSEFGMLTETTVGKDFLTTARLKDIADKIALHEDNLRRIQELKERLAKSRVPIEQMPPDKQDIYLGVLQKEQNSHIQLRSLMRRKRTLSQGLEEFLSASVKVLDTLYPPVRIQIADAIREVTEKLRSVTLSYSKHQGIVDYFTGQEEEDGQK